MGRRAALRATGKKRTFSQHKYQVWWWMRIILQTGGLKPIRCFKRKPHYSSYVSTSDWMMMCSNTTSGKSQALAQTEWSTQCPLTPALSQDPEAPIGNTRESIIDYFRTWKPPPLLWHSEKQKKIQRAQEWTRLIWGCCGCGRISRIDVSPIIQTNLSITADCLVECFIDKAGLNH